MEGIQKWFSRNIWDHSVFQYNGILWHAFWRTSLFLNQHAFFFATKKILAFLYSCAIICSMRRETANVLSFQKKAKPWKFLQRADGWCESAEGTQPSTFGAVGESRKGKPFIAVWVVRKLVFGQCGWQRGSNSRPCFWEREFFYFVKNPGPRRFG